MEQRINSCPEGSLNGKKIDHDSYEMRAIVAYIQHLSIGYSNTQRINGHGLSTLEMPNRAANPMNGQRVYEKHCITCNGQNGQGGALMEEMQLTGKSFPPLWGDDSYKDGHGTLINGCKVYKR